ncbi:MAG: hypothetical protein WBV77_07790 [Solirubrobacteraceae bacterium]
MTDVDVTDLLPGKSFSVVPVTAFPFAHNPFRCPHYERFCNLERACAEAPDGVVGKRWHLTLTGDDLAACEFHEADWCSIAEASVAALRNAGPRATKANLRAACSEQKLPRDDALWLYWLFADPIDWRPGEPNVTNGQHRLCALRAAGAQFVAADTRGYSPPPTPTYDSGV